MRVILIALLALLPFSVDAQSRKKVKKPRVSLAQTLLNKEGVERFPTINEIQTAVLKGLLYPIPTEGISYAVDSLPPERRYCRPWSLTFLEEFAEEMIDSLGKSIIVTSCVRDEKAQARLRRASKSAAQVKGKNPTTHYSGAAIDISFRSVSLETGKIVRLSGKNLRIVTRALARRKKKGLLVYQVERAKNHWHVVVSKKYQELHENRVGLTPIEFYNQLFAPQPR